MICYSETIMVVPANSNFPAIDAVVITYYNNERYFYMLQVTRNKKHNITGSISMNRFTEIVNIAGGVKKCALLFALPNNNIFQDFKIQHIPKVGNSIVVFSDSVTIQSVQSGLESGNLNFASGSSDFRSCNVILPSGYSVKESGRV